MTYRLLIEISRPFRIDGVLRNGRRRSGATAIVSRLKIATGSMSIAGKRLMDAFARIGGSRSTSRLHDPTNHGESVVMRVLDKSSLMLGLPSWIFQ
jgi:type II secretory ATPase GspE/PulE/Tfp pilus assembly ATPase PilB-like protein